VTNELNRSSSVSHQSDQVSSLSDANVIVIGAGPAGLTAAYEAIRAGLQVTVLEKDDIVGGISRTVSYKGYCFDIGGHRFFTKVKAVDEMWHDVLKDEFLLRPRQSRILYNKHFFHYPLRPFNALLGLGIWTSTAVVLSYLKAFITPIKNEKTFEDWISNRFGKRLYRIFFKTYTEKVWGIPCSQITAEWAAQRIKGLSIKSALKNALLGSSAGPKQGVIKTLIDSFYYPKRGPGMMWERVAQIVKKGGSDIKMQCDVAKIFWADNRVSGVQGDCLGHRQHVTGTHYISSMPIRELVERLVPPPPRDVVDAATNLHYRDFLTVALIVDKPDVFPDNWIYIHDDSVHVGRIQNFKNWSPLMVPDDSTTCLGLEYFCFEGDDFWTMADEDLIELATQEIEQLGLVDKRLIVDGTVVRMPKAYPVYDEDYAKHLQIVRGFLDKLQNIQLVGRNGMHKYNNQDHSMLTAMAAVENIRGGNFDLWSLNADAEYHEEITDEEAKRVSEHKALQQTQPKVPVVLTERTIADTMVQKVISRMDKAAFAVSLGIVSGLYVFIITLWVTITKDSSVASFLSLLNQYLTGYTVSYSGALIGLLYGFFWGFIFGWSFAYVRNLALGLYLHYLLRRGMSSIMRNLLEYI
jgi:protoporphyrinogen oxidase